jgi:ParB family chromosome partitioning protein
MSQDKKKVLGRGLESLLPRKPQAAGAAAGSLAAEAGVALAAREAAGQASDAGVNAGLIAAEKMPSLTDAAGLKLENIQAAAETIEQRGVKGQQEWQIHAGRMVMLIPVHLLQRNPFQTRFTAPDDPGLDELVESIKVHGVMQPVVVRPLEKPGPQGELYHLVAGERRWLASKRLGKTHLPAIVRELSATEAMVLTIIENLHRQDLNPMQHARSFYRLMEEFRLTQEEIASQTAMPRSVIANYLRLTRLPELIQKAIEEGRLSFGHAKVLLPLASTEAVEICAKKVLAGRLSVRETEMLVEEFLKPPPPLIRVERKVDPNVRAAEEEMTRSLGCRVFIKDRNGRGKIEIEYKTLEDFDRVVGALK